MMLTTNTTDPSKPDWKRPEVVLAQAELNLMHRLLGGTLLMWAHATEYIRKWTDEDQGLYDIRKTIETVYGALTRVLGASIGMLFAKPPGMTWNRSEVAMTEQWTNIDAEGTAGPVFVKRFAEQALADGHALILVDHSPPPENVVITAANEGPLGLRPIWARYGREQVCSWRTGTVANQKLLTQVVLYETSEVEDKLYGMMLRHRYRVLRLLPLGEGLVATWWLYELQASTMGLPTRDFLLVGSGIFRNRQGETRGTLPIAIAYTGRTDAPLTSRPPLIDVAYGNLAHWQKATNLSFYEDFCAFPQPVVIGDLAPDPILGRPQSLKVGPGTAVQISQGGSYHIMELSGTALEQLRKGLDEKLFRIASTSLSFLLPQTRAAETAEAKRLDATAENSTLATAGQGIEDAVNLALEHHAWYLGIAKADAPVLTINRDYDSTAISSEVMQAFAALVAQGFPRRVVLEALQAGGRIPADADLDDLELQWMAGQAAVDAEREMERAAMVGTEA